MKEEYLAKQKRKREVEDHWESGATDRLSSWRDFAGIGSKPKKSKKEKKEKKEKKMKTMYKPPKLKTEARPGNA